MTPDREMAATAGDDPSDDHAVLLARARRAKLAQWTAFLVVVGTVAPHG